MQSAATPAIRAGTEDAKRLCDRLRNRQFPEIPLPPFKWGFTDRPRVIYTYHGLPEGASANDSAAADEAQHIGFRELARQWSVRDIRVIGLSTQSEAQRTHTVITHWLEHEIVGDPKLLVADALRLPTFTHVSQRHYERLVMIIAATGRIAHVFYPLTTPGRAAFQVLTWLKLYSPPDPGATDHAS